MKKKKFIILLVSIIGLGVLTGCADSDAILNDNLHTSKKSAANIVSNQPSPTDIDYSLERYNLIKRAYWVNGQREKANSLPCEVEKPLGYIVLFSDRGIILNQFVVDGKVSSLGSYLYSAYDNNKNELPGIDGAFGSNADGIFFFTVDGNYIEWTGTFLYSDVPFNIDNPILNIKEGE